jgi:regulator of protease activity HflC (stomatin/prohibitin superfamily)
MELQMAAERKKRAAILTSEGHRTTLINEAQGRAQAALTSAEAQRQVQILHAEAESERQRIEAEGLQIAIKTVAEGIRVESEGGANPSEAVEAAVQFLSLIRYMETQAKFAGSEGSKVIMLPSKDSLPLTYGGLKYLMD